MKNVKYIFFLLLFGLLCAPAAFAKRKQSPVAVSERKRQEQIYFFHEGKKYMAFGNAKNAAYCFKRALKADSYCDACYYELANIAVAVKQFDDVLTYLRAAYALDSANVWYSLRLAQQLAMSERFVEAEAYYEKAIALNPQLQEAYVELMLVYDKEEKYAEAVQMLTRYQQNFGVDASSLVSKQGFLYKQGKVDEAIVEAKTLVEMYPSEQEYWLVLAELYDAQDSSGLAMGALHQAKTLDSASQDYLAALSEHYRRTSDFDSYFAALLVLFSDKTTPITAKHQVLDFLQQFPAIGQSYEQTIDSLYALTRAKYSYQTELLFAKHLIQTKRVDDAIVSLKIATARGAYDAYLLDVIKNKRESKFFAAYALESVAYYEAWGLFFDLLIVRQMWARLLTEVDTYDTIFPDKFRVSYLRGLANFQQKKYAEALHFWLQAEKFSTPTDTATLAHLYTSIGDVYFLQKEYSKTDKYFSKALKLQPNNILALNNYAYYLSLRKTKLSKALSMSRITIDAEPNNATYLDTYAWILYEMGRYEEAKKVFQRALVNGGNEEGVMLEHYGDVLYALGEFSNAQIYWQRALEKGNDTPELREKLKKLAK